VWNFGVDKVQTYLITYPLFDVDLDFKKYIDELAPDLSDMKERVWLLPVPEELSTAMKTAYNLSAAAGKLDGENLRYEDWLPLAGGTDKITIPLGHMKNVISDITFDNEERVKIVIKVRSDAKETTKDALQKAVRIRAPRIMIGKESDEAASWVVGTWEYKDGIRDRLVFEGKNVVYNKTEGLLLKSEGEPAQKKASENVEIEIKLANRIDEGDYYLQFDFNWYSVDIKPQSGDADSEGNFSGEFEGFNLKSYLTAFGEDTDTDFKKVPAHFYIDHPKTVSFDVKIADSDGKELDEDKAIAKAEIDDILDKDEPVISLVSNPPTHSYDFTDTFNEGGNIKYKIILEGEVTVEREKLDKNDTKVTANLVVLLPMIFDLSSGNKFIITDGNDKGSYIPINFAGMDDFQEGNSNVMGQIDEQLKGSGSVRSLTLKFSDIQNEVTGNNLYLAIERDADKWTPVQLADGSSHPGVPIMGGEDSLSFSQFPKIKFLLKAEVLGTVPPAGTDILGDAPLPPGSNEEGSDEKALFYIKEQVDENSVAFNVNISVVADIDLDTKIDL
jgi:hypothetical protein